MKTGAKVGLIIAAVLVVVGLIGAGLIVALGGWRLPNVKNAEFGTRTVLVEDDFDTISIESDTEDIVFGLSEDGSCQVVFREYDFHQHTAEVKGNTLEIRGKDTRKWYERAFSFSFEDTAITLLLPERVYDLMIDEDTGKVTIPEATQFGNVDVKTSTGDVDFGASAANVKIRCSTGDIHVAYSAVNSLDLEVSTGHVKVSSVECAGDFRLKVSTGKSELKDVRCGSFTSNGSTGDIEMEGLLVSGALNIERSTGDVQFDGCDASELEVKTDTGKVTGTLLTEKVFIVKSDTGKIDVPESTNGSKCKITTDTGRISISIK